MLNSIYQEKLSETDFKRLSKFIYGNYGIKMPDAKIIMLQSRLLKRLKALNLKNFKEYVDYVFSSAGKEEIIHMIDVVSTNKTDFYREANHFKILETKVFPTIEQNNIRHIKIWSAGCSSGEECYSIAMVTHNYFSNKIRTDFSILGTDISTLMLKKAQEAIYSEKLIQPLPEDLKRKYIVKIKNDEDQDNITIDKNIVRKVSYQRLNFMDNFYNVDKNFNIIFCRNVLIYFDRETQQKVINNLANHLVDGGYLFLGHSEATASMNITLKQIQPTLYIKEK